MRAHRSAGILLFLALLPSACAWLSTPSTAVVTLDGFHTRLPEPGTRAMFPELSFSGRSSAYDFTGEGLARDAVATWLSKRGVTFVVPVSDRYKLVEEQRFRLQHDGGDTLRVGKMQGASIIVDVHIGSGSRDPSVTVRATSVETGEIVWSGTAQMPPRMVADYSLSKSTPVYRTAQVVDGQTLSLLACGALNVAFGLEQPGSYRVPLDHICTQ